MPGEISLQQVACHFPSLRNAGLGAGGSRGRKGAPSFYGRGGELATLAQWMVQDRRRVVSVLGLAAHFDVVLFRSLRDAPSCAVLLESCLQVLAPQPLVPLPRALEPRLSLLLAEPRRSRVLLVLDNLEVLLQV